MANLDAPYGATPVGHLAGGIPNRTMEFPIASGYATAIYEGDFVMLVAGGGIEVAAATNRICGVFAGVKFTDTDGEPKIQNYWPAAQVASDAKAIIYADPQTIFQIQANGNTVAADVGQLADIVATAGNSVTKRSKHELNTAGQGTGSAQLRIIGKTNEADNAWGTNVNLMVLIHEHEFVPHDPATDGV